MLNKAARFLLIVLTLLLVSALGYAVEPAQAPPEPSALFDPFSFILLELGIIVMVALLAHTLADRFRFPAILAELCMGVAVGNVLYWLGWSDLFFMIMHLGDAGRLFWEVWNSGLSIVEAAGRVFSPDELAAHEIGGRLVETLTGPDAPVFVLMGVALWQFSNLGIVFLLFKVGLDSNLEDMLKVGSKAFLVAIIGIAATVLLSLAVGSLLFPNIATKTLLLIGAALASTSMPITSRVLQELNMQHSPEGSLVLGAAVLDDVLEMILLTIVLSAVLAGTPQPLQALKVVLFSVLFVGAVVYIGKQSKNWRLTERPLFQPRQTKLLAPVALAFILSWLASMVELSVILGAFTAGLLLSGQIRKERAQGEKTIEASIMPLEAIFTPIFFVLMGMQVNLKHFASPHIIWLALALTLIAVLGKMACALVAERGMNRLAVGIALVPRAEMGLIIAGIGKGLGVIGDALFSALAMAILMTSLIAPLALKWSLLRSPRAEREF